jgi:FdhE protein
MFQTKKPDWSKRIERAIDLAGRHLSASEILVFYSRILEFQKTLYDSVASQPTARRDGTLRQRLEVDTAMRELHALLALVRKSGPPKLAREATEIGRVPEKEHRRMLNDFLSATNTDVGGPDSFFARVLFQPQAEYLAATSAAGLTGFAGSVCPVCDARPQVAVLHPEGDGGKRFLICSFCLTEWEFRRILCPVCGEVDHAKLSRYTAEGIPAIHIETCDTCKRYLKAVDMTVDGLAVPLVDEVATAPFDVWALEHGFSKISLNLMGF